MLKKNWVKILLSLYIDAPNLSAFRLVDVFTSVTDMPQKEGIIVSFTSNSHLRIVISTIAANCPCWTA